LPSVARLPAAKCSATSQVFDQLSRRRRFNLTPAIRQHRSDHTGNSAESAEVRLIMTNRRTLIAWEMCLLFASILVFRSVWTLLDRWPWATGTPGLIGLFILGSGLCYLAFRSINES
jgi:hypothetical protein